jgi:predicted membrane GTPase involved in stress response
MAHSSNYKQEANVVMKNEENTQEEIDLRTLERERGIEIIARKIR